MNAELAQVGAARGQVGARAAPSGARPWWLLLAALALLRLLSLPLYPLADATEARYAEIARLMLASGDWITPQIAPGEPFLAKPPLSTWSQAASMALFGVHDWAARLPAWAWTALALAALWTLARTVLSRTRSAFALALLASMPLVYIGAGAVMTEAALLAALLWMQAAFWHGLQAAQASVQAGRGGDAATRRWARVLGAAAGAALLAKGPAALVLGALPGIAYLLWRRPGWPALARLCGDLPAWGLLVGLALPWYVAAEWASPGFLAYFIVGEHLQRFLQPGWSGDRYGFAHAAVMPGIVWVYAVAAALPWPLVLALRALARARKLRTAGAARALVREAAAAPTALLGAELARYALLMMLAPLALFSLSRNLIWTYALPALPGLALLSACWLDPKRLRLLGVPLVLVYAAFYLLLAPRLASSHSQAGSIAAYLRACPARDCAWLDLDEPRYSSRFYSQGLVYLPPQGAGGRPLFVVAARDHPQAELLRRLGAVVDDNGASLTVRLDPARAATIDWIVRRPLHPPAERAGDG
jgi:4-amino-4-deoxy-L-arabinose transferase-like glycosyltransferase